MKTWLLLIAGFTVALVGCKFSHLGNSIKGSGNLVTTNLVFTGFQSVEADAVFKVRIKPGDQFAVSVTADDNIIDRVSVTQDGSRLRFGLKSGLGVSPTKLGAEVVLPRLNGVSASGAAQITLASFKTDEFTVEASGASRVEGALEADQGRVESSGASKVVLAGNVSAIKLNGSGASVLECARLKTIHGDVDLSGVSKAAIDIADSVDYHLSGASHLDYSGQPRIGRNECSGASSVHRD